MQFSPSDVKEKLLKALDKDNNVVDMPRMLEVVSILERYPITKEALEQTRIGKYVNEMRKKTQNKDLAKRAKNLVRRWQQLVVPSQMVNGERVVSKNASSVPARLLADAVSSRPVSPASLPSTPASIKSLSPGLQPSRSQLSPKVSVSRPGTPGQSGGSRPGTPGFQSKPVSPGSATSNSSNNNCKPNSQSATQRPGLPGSYTSEAPSKTNVADRKRRRNGEDFNCDKPAKKMALAEDVVQPATPNGVISNLHERLGMSNDAMATSKSQTADGKGWQAKTAGASLISSLPSDSVDTPNSSKSKTFARTQPVTNKTPKVKTTAQLLEEMRSSTPSFSDTVDSRSKSLTRSASCSITPKVKTTAELIEQMSASGSLKLRRSETVTKIALNQIEKEHDTDVSIVPAGAKPRPRKKPGSSTIVPPVSDKTLSQTKTEMVQKFLQSSVAPTSDLSLGPSGGKFDSESPAIDIMDNWDALDSSVARENSHSVYSFHSDEDSRLELIGTLDTHRDHGSENNNERENGDVKSDAVPPLACSSRDIDDPWSLLPPLNLAEIKLHEEPYPVRPPLEVTDEVIDKLHAEEWPGVNGQNDSENRWHDWSETYSMPSYKGELLHILPYVNIDD